MTILSINIVKKIFKIVKHVNFGKLNLCFNLLFYLDHICVKYVCQLHIRTTLFTYLSDSIFINIYIYTYIFIILPITVFHICLLNTSSKTQVCLISICEPSCCVVLIRKILNELSNPLKEEL